MIIETSMKEGTQNMNSYMCYGGMKIQNGVYTRLARAVAKACMGEKGAWKSRIKLPLSILPNCRTCEKHERKSHTQSN